MIENQNWSSSLGRWIGIPVRVHALLALFIVGIFAIASQHPNGGPLLAGTALATTLVLLVSILFHEVAHGFAATNLGGHIHSIVLTPWGGNSSYLYPPSNQAKIIIHLAGPFANLVVFLFCAALLVQTDQASMLQLMNPFDPHALHIEFWEASVLKIIAWTNFQLFLFNMIPCYPFDSAHVLRTSIEILNPNISKLHIEESMRVFGQAITIVLIGCAWFAVGYDTGPIQPVWALIAGFAVTIWYSTRFSFVQETSNLDAPWDELNELEQISLFDESNFFDYETENLANYSQWLSEKQEARRQEEVEIELEELERSDTILDKLHQHGIDSLTEEEKSLLARVSQRLRAQREQQIQDS